MRKRKVVHLTSVHRAYDTRIFVKECKTLCRAGYEVTLVAPHTHEEEIDGVKIRPIRAPKSRWKRMLVTTWSVFRIALEEDGQIYHFHDPELIPMGILLRLLGKRVIYDVHENVPLQIMCKHWIPRWLRGIVASCTAVVEHVSGWIFSGFITADTSVAQRFPQSKTETVHNFPILQELIIDVRPERSDAARTICYVGGISLVRGVREMIQAFKLLPRADQTRLVLAGVFQPPALQAEVLEGVDSSRIEYVGWGNRKEIAELMGYSVAGLCVLHPISKYCEAFPTKVFEYMSVGLPAIVSDFPFWKEVLGGTGGCLFVNPLDPASIAQAIAWVLAHPDEAREMGQRGRAAIEERMNWEREADKLVRFYRRWGTN